VSLWSLSFRSIVFFGFKHKSTFFKASLKGLRFFDELPKDDGFFSSADVGG
jgi:hypothetical protein